MNGMRAAAKSSALAGYRSIGLLAGRVAVAARLRASHPAIATVSVEGGPSVSICSRDKGSEEASSVSAVQKPWWEEEVVALESLDPAPRLVFGPVPMLEEAKEATSDLADTLKDDIVSGDFALSMRDLRALQKPWWEEEEVVALESLDRSPKLVFGPVPTLEEAKEATSDLADTLKEMYPFLIPSHSSTEVLHASFQLEATFELLLGSPDVQNAVASIAADKNVWYAMMKNPNVIELCKTHNSIVFPPESSCFVTEVPMADEDDKSSTAEPTNCN